MQATISIPVTDTSMTPHRPCLLSAAPAQPSFSTGKERDAESGNDYFGARYYASSMGRFLSPDPKIMTARHLVNPQKWNKYAYVINNPLMRFDPDGKDDYIVFRTKTSGYDQGSWDKIASHIRGTTDSKGRPNTFTMYQGGQATVENYNSALKNPDAHIAVVSDVGHVGNRSTPAGLVLDNGISRGANGSDSIVTGASPAPGVPGSTTMNFVDSVPVNAAEVAIFGCDSMFLASQYSNTNYTGVSYGDNGSIEFETADLLAQNWADAGGGQGGADAANEALQPGADIYMQDEGDEVQTVPRNQTSPPQQ